MTFAGPEPRTFSGHDGLRAGVGRGPRQLGGVPLPGARIEEDGVLEVGFRGIEQMQGIELSGVLWFRVEERDGQLARVWSALDAGELPS